MISTKLQQASDQKEKVQLVWDFYLSRKLSNDLEPEWTHAAYDLCQQFLNCSLSVNQIPLLHEVIKSHELDDGSEVYSFAKKPNSPIRVMQDGWKIGSPSWIFMGRNLEDSEVFELGEGWVAVCRTVTEKLMNNFYDIPNWSWMAYNRKNQMGMSGETSNIIGPSFYVDVLIHAVENETKTKLNKAWEWVKKQND